MSLPSETQAPKPSEKGYSFQPAGLLLGKSCLVILLVIFLLAVWFDQVMIVVLLGLALSAVGLAKLWSQCSLVGVHCQRFLNEQRVFPGEYIELRLRLVNRKPLPLPWVRVDDKIPERLVLMDSPLTPRSNPGDGFLSNTASLLWYRGINWRYRLHCTKRGYYSLGPLVVSSGDIFGFYPRSITRPSTDHVIVYSKLFPLAQLGLPSLYSLGEIKAERRIFEDSTRTIGVRDYSPSDSLRYIHWKASARHQKLQVKVFEPTTTLKAILFLAVDSFHSDGVKNEDDFELGISTAASIANYVVQQRSPVGLFVNALLPDSGQPVRILPGGGPNQLINVLEALAKVVLVPSGSIEEFLQGERSSLPWGATIVMIISKPSEFLPELLELQQLCRQVYVEDSVRNYIVAIARATRGHQNIKLGASPRASLSLHLASQALAAIRGRNYVIPDDVKYLAVPALAHRLIIRAEARLRGRSLQNIVEEVVSAVPVPVEATT